MAGVTYLRYTVLLSPDKDDTPVHCCDPASSILVMFGVSKCLSRISALQSTVSTFLLLLLFFFFVRGGGGGGAD